MSLGRPIWTGHIRLSLVNMAVRLYSATEPAARPRLRQVHEPSGQAIKYEKVVPGIGPVDRDEIVKAFEIEKDDFVILSEEEMEDIKLESKKTLELVQFVDACDIDPIYFDKPYFVAPDGDLAEEAFSVLREGLKKSGKIGLGQLVMRGREYIGALKPCNRGMTLETLRFEEEIRKSDPYFAEIDGGKPDKELLSLAEELIERKTKPFDASNFRDQYSVALRELIERKSEGRKPKKSGGGKSAQKGAEVVDLMAALKKSVGQDKKGGKSRSSSSSSSSSRSRKTASNSNKRKKAS